MRGIHFFNLVVIVAATLFTWNSLASPLKIHVMDNLSPVESKIVFRELAKMGYAPTSAPLFSESTHAVVITKTLPSSAESEALSFEILKLNANDALPKTLFEIKSKDGNLESFLKNAPSPDQIRTQIDPVVTPMAVLK
jgi:hypothetical protein